MRCQTGQKDGGKETQADRPMHRIILNKNAAILLSWMSSEQ